MRNVSFRLTQAKFSTFGCMTALLLTMFFVKTLSAEQMGADKPTKAEVIQKTKKIQIPFIANMGQTDKRVKFYANTFGGTVFVTKEGEIGYSLIKTERQLENSKADEIRNLKPEARNRRPSKAVYLREELIGGKTPEIKGEERSVTKVNWFKGNDQSRWKTNVPTYECVSLGEVYEGIEVKLKAHGDTVEKLFYVKQGADPGQIKLKLDGVKDCGVQNTHQKMKNPNSEFQNLSQTPIGDPKLSINKAGELVVKTALGGVKFSRPVAYQEINGKRVEVDVGYRVQKSKYRSQNTETNLSNQKSTIQNQQSEYGFRVASYDKTRELIIDPLLASTFLGGTKNEYANSIVVDSNGNIYVVGVTGSSDFPTTTTGYDTFFSGQTDYYGEAFVSKLNGDLTSLLASTFLGGSNDE